MGFYINDRQWGRMFDRICPYLPFSARLADAAAHVAAASGRLIAALWNHRTIAGSQEQRVVIPSLVMSAATSSSIAAQPSTSSANHSRGAWRSSGESARLSMRSR
jgi:hypothetical protein